MRITDTGNFGIGTTGPATALHIVPSNTGGLYVVNSSTSAPPGVIIGANLTTDYAGYGYANQGSQYAMGSAAKDVIFYNYNSNSSLGNMLFATGTGPNIRLAVSPAGNFNFNSGQVYIQQSSGNVGIGTTGPSNKLHLYGTTGEFGVTVTNTATSGDRSVFNGLTTDAGSAYWGLTGNAGRILNVTGAGDLAFSNRTGGNIIFSADTAYAEPHLVIK